MKIEILPRKNIYDISDMFFFQNFEIIVHLRLLFKMLLI